MLCPRRLRGAAWLLCLCLLTRCSPAPAEEARPGPAAKGAADEAQARPLPAAESGGELFPDVEPEVLAAVLLQALRTEPASDRRPDADEERLRGRTRSADVEPRGEAGPGERPADGSDDPRELQASEPRGVHSKRRAPPSEPWAGARKLRQQQHLEHQLLQRRYEELAESRRQAEEARRAAAEEERLADMASDLLLQYLLKDGEGEGEGEEGARRGASAQEEQEQEQEQRQGSSLLFEDEEGNVAEDKRSNEAPGEEDEEDIDPNTIDRLIELSSKLHLPADDVIDIISDVEKKKKDVPEPSKKSKALIPPPRDKPRKAAPPSRADPGPVRKQHRPPARQDEAAWNEVLRGDEYPAPKWFPAKATHKVSNYISPRTFQPPAYHRFRHLPGPPAPRSEYYDDSTAGDQELDNYIERLLMERPKVFQ